MGPQPLAKQNVYLSKRRPLHLAHDAMGLGVGRDPGAGEPRAGGAAGAALGAGRGGRLGDGGEGWVEA